MGLRKGDEKMITSILVFFAYVTLAGIWVAGLTIGAEMLCPDYDPLCDVWPVLCGAFWPLAGIPAAAYIFAQWYLGKDGNHE